VVVAGSTVVEVVVEGAGDGTVTVAEPLPVALPAAVTFTLQRPGPSLTLPVQSPRRAPAARVVATRLAPWVATAFTVSPPARCPSG
jgi:hypothetical protein